MAAGTVFAVGDRVVTRFGVNMLTHEGRAFLEAGTEGVVETVLPDRFREVRVRFDKGGLATYNLGFSPDQLAAVREEGDEHA